MGGWEEGTCGGEEIEGKDTEPIDVGGWVGEWVGGSVGGTYV